jgi:D-glycero-alpha-D-manno-heptose-7-phosphate kinase
VIISKTPFRVSLFGGGTDYPVFYREHGGCAISMAIDKYCYINVRYLPPFFDYNYRIRYTEQECCGDFNEIQHPSVRECIRYVGESKGLEIQHNADVPARSGLGSSSTFTVGLLNCLNGLSGRISGKDSLASSAIHVEQNMIKENVGSQDQIAAAFGGLNKIEFRRDDTYSVNAMTLESSFIDEMEKSFLLVFTGFQRMASDIAEEQIRSTPSKQKELLAIRDIAEEATELLSHSSKSVKELGALLKRQWEIKRTLTSKVSTDRIDEIYQAGIDAGAYGGKLLGAGGGGFMLFLAEPGRHEKILEALGGLVHVPFKIDNAGSQVIYYTPAQVDW